MKTSFYKLNSNAYEKGNSLNKQEKFKTCITNTQMPMKQEK